MDKLRGKYYHSDILEFKDAVKDSGNEKIFSFFAQQENSETDPFTAYFKNDA